MLEKNEVYNTNEVAEVLKVTPMTIRQYIKDKKLKAKFIGRAYVITEDSVKEFINPK